MSNVHFKVICDGGSRGNHTGNGHGYGSWQVSLFDPESTLPPFAKAVEEDYGPDVTNNEAEYQALIGALKHIYDAFHAVAADHKSIDVTVYTDSQLVVGQLTKQWKIKAANLRPLVVKASGYCQAFGQVDFVQISGVEMKTILGH